MQLTGPEILRRMHTPNMSNPEHKPDIIIEPFDEKCLGSNSYDLHLGNQLKIYKHTLPYGMRPAIEYKRGQKYSMRDWLQIMGHTWIFTDIQKSTTHETQNTCWIRAMKNCTKHRIWKFQVAD